MEQNTLIKLFHSHGPKKVYNYQENEEILIILWVKIIANKVQLQQEKAYTWKMIKSKQ